MASNIAGIGTLALLMGLGGAVRAQEGPKTDPTKVDLTRDHVLFEIGYSHLDTEWCWNYPQVINQFVSDTLHQNFALFEQYPDYTFNWTGANRYRFMQEYYPQDWVTLKKYVAQGRWFPNGSSLEEGDVNNPSPESIIRQVMYGNNYFRQQFGKAGTDFMLPDCFGFPASLPTILAHAGVKGFSTQKLTWGSAVGIPFNFGVWVGPDDTGLLAALNGGSYTNQVGDDRSQNEGFYKRVDENGKKSGLYVDYVYYGKGDRGGSAGEGSAPFIEKSVHGTGPLKVISGNADTLFNIVTPSQKAKLPTYKGDLELTQHSAGSLTSQTIIKHWNRQNEILADAAEKASVGAMLLGAQPYPMARITDAWWRFLPGQFHDIMAGTALPKSYEFADNDQAIALNEFSDVIAKGVGGISRGLDTRTASGATSIVVYNALSAPRQDVVEVNVALPASAKDFVARAMDGSVVPAQVVGRTGGTARVAFRANVPPVGMAVYSIAAVPTLHETPITGSKGLIVSADTLENERYRVKLNAAGDVASIFDKKANKEMLAAPMRLAFQYENPGEYPAWNMDWSDQQKPPRGYVDGPAKVEIVENGPVRVALRVTRTSEGSTFAQTVRLASGAAGNRVEFVNDIDWKSKECALKAVFPLTVSNPDATYNWGMGTITRGNNYDRRYEAASQQWFDLTAPDNSYGVTVLTDDKHGSDKPDDSTLRLTMIYTPGTRAGYQHQATQDWGRHHIVYGLEGHTGDWRQGDSQWEAARLNQPLMAFHAPAHPGALGKSFSLASVSTPQVRIDALKRAEADADTIIVRFNELTGKPAQSARLKMAAPILSMHEVDGQEQTIPGTAAATLEKGELVFDMAAYRPRAFALHLGKAPATLTAPTSTPLTLPFDTAATSSAIGQHDGAFDRDGRSLPGELMPKSLESGGVQFYLGPTTSGAKNAVACAGQTLNLPTGTRNGGRLYLLAAAYDGDTPAMFRFDNNNVSGGLTIQDWSGYIGQWDTRLWGGEVPELTYNQTNPMIGLTPGYVKPATVAWYSDHWRLADGKNDAYKFCYLYRYELSIPAGAKTVTLPNNTKIRIFAATIAANPNEEVRAAAPLYDTLADHGGNTPPQISPSTGTFHDATAVSVTPPLYYGPGSEMHYTTDGSEPTTSSPTTTGTVLLARSATLKVRQFGEGGMTSPTATAQLTVEDTTPPSIAFAEATGTNDVQIVFSEPITKSDAENASHYALSPGVSVKGARLSDDNRTVTLMTAAPLPRSGALTLDVNGVKDTSPAGNATTISAKPVTLLGPVYTLAGPQTFDGGRGVRAEADRLPTRGGAPWTINMFVYTDAEPEDLTLLGGFGDGRDSSGAERFLIKFRGGIEFWASNVDVASGVPFDLNKWQMISATYDGKTVRIYKNGEQIKSEDAKLEDAEPRVAIATRGPWDNKAHSFKGKIANFTIWKVALDGDLVKSLLATGPK